MRKIYILTLLMLGNIYGFAQISVTATLGTPGPTPYTTIKTAFDAINAGSHKGVVTVSINGTTIETASAVLFSSGTGSSSYTSLSLKPTGGIASSITGNIAAPLIDLDGADNVTIDGLNSGGNSLTISNTSTSALTNTSTIRFINDALNNTITNSTLLGASTNATLATIFFSSGTTVGNDNNTISNCSISDAVGAFPTNAIISVGSATAGQENSGIVIINNSISNFFNADLVTVGILASTGNTDWTISNNKLFQTAIRTFTTGAIHRGIQVASGNNHNVANNIIGYASSTSTGIYTIAGAVANRFIGIDLAVGTTIASSVQNNTISGFLMNTSSGASTLNGVWCGIYITTGNVNVGTITGNTIGSTSSTGTITVSPTTGGAHVLPINSSSIGIINISNNLIGGIDVLPTGVNSGNLQSIQTSGASGNVTITNNLIGNTLANNMKIGVLGTTTGNGIIRGILNSNAGTVLISGNTIRNLTHNSSNAVSYFRGIECQNGVATIFNNTITNLTAAGASLTAFTPEGAGILATTALPGLTIDSNRIFNLSVTNTTVTTGPAILGIYLGSNVTGVAVTRNKIFGLSNAGNSLSSTVPTITAGIYLRDAGATNPNILVANNMISIGTAQTNNIAFIGIWNSVTSANNSTTKIYYNTVNIEGSSTAGVQPTACYYKGDFSTTPFPSLTVDIKNNIFTNTRTNVDPGGKNYAISNGHGATTSSAVGWAANASNYNVLNTLGETVGYWSGDVSFSNWKAASAGDGNSLSGVAITYINSASDLHLVTTANAAVNAKATPLAMIIDIDNDTRDATTPDIGADEFIYNGTVPVVFEYFKGKKQGSNNLLNWKGSCSSSSVKFDIERCTDARTFSSIGNFSATQTRCAQPFDYIDNAPKPGTNYYRLKMTEPDGKISYSIIIAIINKETGFEIVSMMPTLVKTTAVLNVTSAQNTNLSIAITDASGRIIIKQTTSIVSGSNMVNLDFSNLSTGTYQITGFTLEGKTRTIKFIKQ